MAKNFTKQARTILKNEKELFYIARVKQENSRFNMTPCECDAMSYFILDALNNGDFDQYYKEYMKL